MTRGFRLAFAIAIILIMVFPLASAVNDLLALQGNIKQSGVDLSEGGITVTIYDSPGAGTGNMVYNSTNDFDGTVTSGKYDVVLGNGTNELNLEYGKMYYMEVFVNTSAGWEQFTFSDGSTRQIFQSSTGQINASYINPNQINSSHLTMNISVIGNLSVGGNLSAERGFFSYLADSASRIINGWFTDLNVLNTLNVTGEIYVSTTPVSIWLYNQSEVYNLSMGALIYNHTTIANAYTDLVNATTYGQYGAYWYNQTGDLWYNQTENSIYYYNQSLSPTITQWLYNQTTNSIYYYNMTSDSIYYYNQTENSIYYYNMTSDSIYYYNQTLAGDERFLKLVNAAGTSVNVTGDFLINATGDINFNGGWQQDGVTISGSDIWARTIFVYNISSLSVSNIGVNGSLLPPSELIFNNTFDIGSGERVWRYGYFGTDAFIGGVAAKQYLYNQTSNSIYYYNQSLSPTITIWLYNQSEAYNNSMGALIYNHTSASNTNWTGNSTAIWTRTGIAQVGIGTSTPTHTLNVVGTVNITQNITIGIDDGDDDGVYLGGGVIRWDESSGFFITGNQIQAQAFRSEAYFQGSSLSLDWVEALDRDSQELEIGANPGWGTATFFDGYENRGITIYNGTGDVSIKGNLSIGTLVKTYPLNVVGSANITTSAIIGNAIYNYSTILFGENNKLITVAPRTTEDVPESVMGFGWNLTVEAGKAYDPESSGIPGGNLILAGGPPADATGRGNVLINPNEMGFVGIGTHAPTHKLNVKGDVNVTGDLMVQSKNVTQWFYNMSLSDAYNYSLQAVDRPVNSYLFTSSADRDAGLYQYQSPAGFALRNSTAGNVMFWADTGKVGIGTTAPTHALNVIGGINATENSVIQNNLNITQNLSVLGQVYVLNMATHEGTTTDMHVVLDNGQLKVHLDTAICPFFQIYNKDHLIEEFEFAKNLNDSTKASWQVVPMNNYDPSIFTMKIKEKKSETSYIDTVQIVLLGTFAREKTGIVSYYVLEPDLFELKYQDNQFLILNEGDEISLDFDEIPKDFVVLSANLRTYGYYIPYNN